MTISDDDRRKELKRQFKARERADAEARLPLEKSDLADLFDHLDERLTEDECDHTLRQTEDFLAKRGLNPALIVPWLRESGGCCDCEVLANVEDEWSER